MVAINDDCQYTQLENWLIPTLGDWKTAKFIFVPIHGGDHWSLLLVRLDHKTKKIVVYHMDSAKNHDGKAISGVMIQWLEKVLPSHLLYKREFRVLDVPLQVNWYDCGFHVLAMVRAMLEKDSILEKALDKREVQSFIDVRQVEKLRVEVNHLCTGNIPFLES